MLQTQKPSPRRPIARILGAQVFLVLAFVANQACAQTPVAPAAPSKPATAEAPSAFKNWGAKETTSTPPPREMTATEKAVIQRAGERWQLLTKGDYKAAYEYLSPSSKAFKSLAAFEAEASASTLSEVKPTRAECDKDGRCSVTLAARAGLQQPRVGMLGVPVLTQEVWSIQASGEALLILR